MSDTAGIVIEMQTITRRAAEPWQPGDSVKAAIGRASRALGIGYRRARSFWYGETVAVRAIEADRMRAAERLLLTQRRQRLEHDLAAIRAKLNAADEAEARKDAAMARREAGGRGETPIGRVEPSIMRARIADSPIRLSWLHPCQVIQARLQYNHK